MDINETDFIRQTPLFYAAREGHDATIEYMLEQGANPNHRDNEQESAIYYACSNNRLRACELLIKAGAEINMVDRQRRTPMYFAIKNGHEQVVRFLVEKGAIKTKNGKLSVSQMKKLKSKGGRELNDSMQSKDKKHNKVLKYKLVYNFGINS